MNVHRKRWKLLIWYFILKHFHFLLEQILWHYGARCLVFHSQPVTLFAWANSWHSTSRNGVSLWAILGVNFQSTSSQSRSPVTPLTEDHTFASKRFLVGRLSDLLQTFLTQSPSQIYSLEIVLYMYSPADCKLLFCYLMTIARSVLGWGWYTGLQEISESFFFFQNKILSNAYRQSFSYGRPTNLTFNLVWGASPTPPPWTRLTP